MLVPDDEKEGRKAAIKKLMDMMGSESSRRLGSMKQKPGSVPTEEEELEPMREDYAGADMGLKALARDSGKSVENGASDDEDEDDDGPSSDDRMKITEMYNRYCK